jgi:hypothetical protein
LILSTISMNTSESNCPWPIIPTTPLFNSLLDFGGFLDRAYRVSRSAQAAPAEVDAAVLDAGRLALLT